MATITLQVVREDGTLKTKEELQAEYEAQLTVFIERRENELVLLAAAEKFGGINNAISYLISQRPKVVLSPEDEADLALGAALCPPGVKSEEPALNYIFAHPGCLSTEVRREVGLDGPGNENRWAYVLKKLGQHKQIRKEGNRASLRFFAES